MYLHSEPVAPSARGAAVPQDLEALLLACLRKDPAQRPAGADELAARLAACADAGGWGEEDARAWWAEHAPGLGAPSASETARAPA